MATTAANRAEKKEPQSRKAARRPSAKALSEKSAPARDLFAKLLLELFVVFVGVSAAFALDDYREARVQHERREAVYHAIDRELTQMAETHGPRFQAEMTRQLAAWDQAVARGERPLPPTFRLPGAERPPTGAWDAAVATGSIELIDPALFYELARFYNRADSTGKLYQRYSEGAQTQIWPYLMDGPRAFWGADGKPNAEVRVTLQRLRDFRQRQGELGHEALQLRTKLRKSTAADS